MPITAPAAFSATWLSLNARLVGASFTFTALLTPSGDLFSAASDITAITSIFSPSAGAVIFVNTEPELICSSVRTISVPFIESLSPATAPVLDKETKTETVPSGKISFAVMYESLLPIMTVGALGASVSNMKVRVVAAETLPATSTWRTATVLSPSTALKLFVQVWPPSVLYCTLAPDSRLPIVNAPLLV